MHTLNFISKFNNKLKDKKTITPLWQATYDAIEELERCKHTLTNTVKQLAQQAASVEERLNIPFLEKVHLNIHGEFQTFLSPDIAVTCFIKQRDIVIQLLKACELEK